ncbi:ribulose-phosphate 3-epimerase [uncultured Veillonella sp.]|uniref:ribulose-phosphate 3-epimerase n=1 Tax=uncultured Veillonella sp. TaxID=159268 RepID=UPI00260F6E97|nr:ribulose-phosphate 3-epimerase [uncultured Veillonella sp.]
MKRKRPHMGNRPNHTNTVKGTEPTMPSNTVNNVVNNTVHTVTKESSAEPKKSSLIKIAPSMLSADFTILKEDILSIETQGADLLHVDIMDGHFVPNLTFGPSMLKGLSKATKLPFDVHLMVTNPQDYVDEVAALGAEYFTFHAEATPHMHRLVQSIKKAGMKAGIALNPSTPVAVLEDIAIDIDQILIMSVNPGFGGQSFIPQAVNKVRKARSLFNYVKRYDAIVAVDGGINPETAPLVRDAGAQLLVAGSAVFNAPDRGAMIKTLRGE